MACSLLAGQPPAETPKSAPVAELFSQALIVSDRKPDDLQVALANHPDVQIAEAELRLAQAKLAKAKLLVAQQVSAAKARVEQARTAVEQATQTHARVKQLVEKKVASADELATPTTALAGTKAALAAAEADLRMFSGTTNAGQRPAAEVTFTSNPSIVWNERLTFALAAAPAGTVADKLRSVLDKPIALKTVLEKVRPEVALDAVKQAAGIDFVIKWGPGDPGGNPPPVVSLPAGERTLTGWLELLADEFDRENKVRYRVTPYVREYGLLLAAADSKPPGAVTMAEFAQQAVAKPGLSQPVQQKVQGLLNTVVKLEPAKATPQATLDGLAAAAKTDLTIQYPGALTLDPFDQPGGERTVAAWLDLLRDRWVEGLDGKTRYGFYVRDYGLILCHQSEVPPGAVPLSQLK